MTRYLVSVSLLALSLVACDEKKETPPTSQSAAVSATVPPIMSAPPPMASAAPSASAAPTGGAISGAGTDDVSFTAKEPGKDGDQTVKAKVGGAFTLFLPDRDGMSWAADSVGTLGKPKEEVIPGFAPQTLGHQFKWTGLKAGKTTMTFGNRKAALKGAGAPAATFKITLEVN